MVAGTEGCLLEPFIDEAGWSKGNQKYKSVPRRDTYCCAKNGPKIMVLVIVGPEVFVRFKVTLKGSYVFRFVLFVLIL